MAGRNLAAVAPLTPTQFGMLLESLGLPESAVHVEQLSWPVGETVDGDALERAWHQVVADCEALRTGYLIRDNQDPVQFVLKSVELPLEILDSTDAGDAAALQAEQRTRGFDMAAPPLLRIALLRGPGTPDRIVWTFHHLLLDGWSVPLVIGQVWRAYQAITSDRPPPRWSTRPYRDFVAWRAAQPSEEARSFWTGRLERDGIGTPPAPPTSGPPPAGTTLETGFGVVEARLQADSLAALESRCREHRLTLNTLLQAAWALQLAAYNTVEAVTFGATTAGRPPQLAGIESMVGLFITTLPVSMTVPSQADLWGWLAHEQARRSAERAYEHCTTGEIHAWLDLPGSVPLFQTVLVVENYPVPDLEGGSAPQDGIPEIHTEGTETNYPLLIVAAPGRNGLAIRLVHHRARISSADAQGIAATLVGLLERMADGDLSALRSWLAERDVPIFMKPEQPQLKRGPTAEEAALIEVWQQVLALEKPPGLDSHFFDVGGHSLAALKLIGAIRDHFGVDLPLRDVFNHPTISELAVVIAAAGESMPVELPRLLTTLTPGANDRPLFLAPPGAGVPTCYRVLAEAIRNGQAVYGFRTPGLEDDETTLPDVPQIAGEFVAAMRSVQPHGPYRLGGWSFGAMLAWEAARQLQAAGEAVEHLILLDAGGEDERAERGGLARVVSDTAALAGIATQVGVPRSWGQVVMLAQLMGIGLPDTPADLRAAHVDQGLRSFSTWMNNVRASAGYRPGDGAPLPPGPTIDGDVILLRATAGRRRMPDPLQQRLSSLLNGRLRVIDVPGNHMTMVLEGANASVVGRAISTVVSPASEGSAVRSSTLSEPTISRGEPRMPSIIRVVAFDGTEATGGTGYIAASLVNEVRRRLAPEERHRFLNNATVFSGTSAGSANALFFAMSNSPDDAVAHIDAFWKRSERISSTQSIKALGLVKALVGFGPLLDLGALRRFYIDHFGMTTLGELPRKVIIPTFQLDQPTAIHRSWQPRVFHNLDENSPDMEELVVDVLMRSSSPPLMTPAAQSLSGKGPGYIDGGVWANNPAIAALAQIADERGDGSIDGVSMLSVGNGRAPLYMTSRFKDGSGDLGYFAWLLNPRNPGALLDVLLDSNELSSTFQAGAFLTSRFHRLNPKLSGRIMQFTDAGIDDSIEQVLALDNTQERVEQTLAWLDRVGWTKEVAEE